MAKNFFSTRFRSIFFLIFLSFALTTLSACRSKCTPKSSDYPACLDSGQQTFESEKKANREIVIWNLFDPQDAFRGQIQSFQSQNPRVRVVYKEFQNEKAYEELLINEIAEGKGPDIFAIHHSWLPKHQKKISPAPASVMIPEQFRRKFFDVTSEVLIREDADGIEKIYGVPLFVDTLALFYNTSILRNGLQKSNRPGETWSEIKEQAFALSRSNNSVERFAISGMAMGRADNIDSAIDILSLLFLQEGLSLWDEKGKRSILAQQQGTIAGSGKGFYPAREAINLYTSFALPSYKHYSWNRMITGLSPQQKEMGVFVRGKTAMIFGYSSRYFELIAFLEGQRKSGQETIRTDEIGIAPVPQFSDSQETGKRHALANFYPLTVSRNSQNPELAWELLAFLADTESAREYHQKTKKPTARFDLIEEQIAEKTFGVFARQVPFSKTLPVINGHDFSLIFSRVIDQLADARSEAPALLSTAEKQMQCVWEKEKGIDVDRECTE